MTRGISNREPVSAYSETQSRGGSISLTASTVEQNRTSVRSLFIAGAICILRSATLDAMQAFSLVGTGK